jgi:C1A family cysteine protease
MHIFNWKPDLPDIRDKVFLAPMAATSYPSSFSMRSKLPKPYDQGDLGSCTANALAASLALQLILEKKLVPNETPKTTPSRLFIYYNERAIEGTINEDSGAYIRDGIKSLNKQGACFESDWPYSINAFARKPSTLAYKNALPNTVKQYMRINVSDLNAKKSAIITNHAIVFGITVYESFESDAASSSGLIPMPDPNETMLGGHAMAIVGYDDNKVIGKSKGAFEVRNSWGTTWGDHGYCWIPYDYLNNSNLCDDNWIIKLV